MNQEKSNEQYDKVIAGCKTEFVEKNKKYGNSLDNYNAMGILSKIFIKLYRITSIQEAGEYKVEGEPIEKEFPGIINYSLFGITVAKQLTSGMRICHSGDILFKEYDDAVKATRDLFQKKNHDYGEAWRQLSVSYMTQECLVKYNRMLTMYAELKFKPEQKADLQKEFIEVFSDICNYNIFCSIRTLEGADPMV